MKKNIRINRLTEFFKTVYMQLFKINDTPQRIAIGLGLGVFLGIMPGTGPIAALLLAWIFPVNRASALLGSLTTNTWLSVVTFLLSIKIGSAIMQVGWQDIHNDWMLFLKNFHWLNLLKLSVLKIIFPVIVGYFIVAFCLGLLSYLITLIILSKIKHAGKS